MEKSLEGIQKRHPVDRFDDNPYLRFNEVTGMINRFILTYLNIFSLLEDEERLTEVVEEGYVSGKEDVDSELVHGRTVNRKQGKKRANSGEFYSPLHLMV